MKFKFRKILSLVLAAFVAFGMLGVGTLAVNAETENWVLNTEDSIWEGANAWFDVYDEGNDAPGGITSVTSGNTGVLSIEKEVYDGVTEYRGLGVAPGTAQVTVNFTTPSGQTKSLTKNIVVKAYPKEIKSLKVNGKKVNTSKNKFFYNKKVSKSKGSVKIKMALKKGWKITNIYADRSTNGDKYTQFKVKKSALKNGKAIKFGKKYKYMWINVTMKKGNDIIQYTFDFYR
jgi:hypothetical protein